jgi:hypothetical protein
MKASTMYRTDRARSKARHLLVLNCVLAAVLLLPMSKPRAEDHDGTQARHVQRQTPAHAAVRRDDRGGDRRGHDDGDGAPPVVYAPEPPPGVSLFLSL